MAMSNRSSLSIFVSAAIAGAEKDFFFDRVLGGIPAAQIRINPRCKWLEGHTWLCFVEWLLGFPFFK